MTKEERLNIIQEVISNIKDDATREMYQRLPKRIVYPVKWDAVKVVSNEQNCYPTRVDGLKQVH